MKLSDAGQYFTRLIKARQLSHAYLLTGDVGAEKYQLIERIIQTLVCSNKTASGEACLECPECQRVQQGHFADRLTLKPEGAMIKVDQVRQLKEWLMTSPIEAPFKLAVIDGADQINPSAANALLLFLEEPHDASYIFLLARQSDRLLATITSRVQEIYLEDSPLDRSLQAWIQAGIHPPHAEILLQVSSRSLEDLQAVYEAQAFEDQLKAYHQFYLTLAQRDPQAFIWPQRRLKKEGNLFTPEEGLDYLIWLNQQLLLAATSSQPAAAINADDKSVQQVIDRLGVRVDYGAIDQRLFESKARLLANVSPQLVYERLALTLCQWPHR